MAVNTPPIRAGDRVRAFDFPGIREDCYVEGIVEAVLSRESRYKIRVDRCVQDGAERLVEEGQHYVFPLINGLPALGSAFTDVTCGVVRIPQDGEVLAVDGDTVRVFNAATGQAEEHPF